MKVVICGAGQVGFHIAQYLSKQENNVTVIDQSSDLIQKIRSDLEVSALVGHGSDPNVLNQAGIKDAEMLIAVTSSDEVNMVACQVASSLFNVPLRIARIRNRNYLSKEWKNLFGLKKLPIDFVISPEIELAEAIYRRLEIPGAFEVIPFASSRVSVVGLKLNDNCPVLNTPLKQLSELFPDLNITVMTIHRGKRLFIPSANDHMEAGDSIYFTAESSHVPRAMVVFGHEEKEARHIVIIGGGNVGHFLGELIEQRSSKLSIKIIELDKERADFLASHLQKTLIINGDALDNEILSEANIEHAETIIAVSDSDEVNILSSLLAKRLGCGRAITLINKQIYSPLVSSLGIDVVLDPKETTVSKILQYTRKGKIHNLHTVRYGEAEILEADILDKSCIADQKIKNLKLPRGVLIGAVVRNKKVIMPRGETTLMTNDRLVLFALGAAIPKVSNLFTVRADFF